VNLVVGVEHLDPLVMILLVVSFLRMRNLTISNEIFFFKACYNCNQIGYISCECPESRKVNHGGFNSGDGDRGGFNNDGGFRG
jgi:hypothetical protein